MTELRKDYFLDRWVIIAPSRKKRRVEFKEVEGDHSKKCFFCPGNEETTPKEIGRIGMGKKRWQMRWFPNKFPVFEQKGSPSIRKKGQLTFASAYGSNEIIVETPSSKKQLWDFKVSEIVMLLKVYNNRINELEKKKNIKYVMIIKNHGSNAGASIKHSHTQVASMSFIPPVIKEEISAYSKGKCKHCSIIKLEKKSARKCFENSSAVAFTPYASRFNYELWIFPKSHVKRLSELSKRDVNDFASIIAKALKKLKKLGIAYNFYMHHAPKGSNLHFHLEITPRLEKWAGLEIGGGINVSIVSPEEAARFYRG